MNRAILALAALLLAAMPGGPARAEVSSITMAKQFGIAYIPFQIMEADHLIEKHAAALGLADFKVDWRMLNGGTAQNEGLLSGQLSFGVGAVPAMLVLWDRTLGTSNAVRGVMGMAVMPVVLNTRNPDVHTIKDLTDRDRIAVPALKVGNHALVLQMAAAAAFGADGWNRLDPLTVALPHPDAAASLMGRTAGQVDTHFASPPFNAFELKSPQVHTILNSVDVMGDASLTTIWTTEKFAAANPKVVQALFGAVQEALATINRDKAAAADRYLQLSGDKIGKADLMGVLDDPHILFTAQPEGILRFAGFMHGIGLIKHGPAALSDIFFPIAAPLGGN